MKRTTSPTKKKAARSKTSAPARAVAPAKRAKATTARKPATGRKGPARKAAPARPRASAHGREHVVEVLRAFDTVMVVTADGEALRARPMAVKDCADDGALTFLTAAQTSKVEEARTTHRGAVVAQGRLSYVSLEGTFTVTRDPDRVAALWRAADKVYFPDGPTDPSIRVMVFSPASAEVWDVKGPKGLRFLFEAAKALIKGERPAHEGETHDRVILSPT